MIGLIDCRAKNSIYAWAGSQPELLEFFDRPVLQHAIEQMVQAGITHCILITENTLDITRRWGTGERWGRLLSAIPPSALVTFLTSLQDYPVVIGRYDCIPFISSTLSEIRATPRTHLFFRNEATNGTAQRLFTGWAVTRPTILLKQCFATHGADGLLSLADYATLPVSGYICSHTPQAFLRSQAAALECYDTGTPLFGTVITPGLRVARNVTLHPSAEISGRVYVGDNVYIGPNVKLFGPLVVCRDSVVGANSSLTDSSVQPQTYLGPGMILQHDVVLDRSIVRAERNVALRVADPGRLTRSNLSLWSYLKEVCAKPPIGAPHTVKSHE